MKGVEKEGGVDGERKNKTEKGRKLYRNRYRMKSRKEYG